KLKNIAFGLALGFIPIIIREITIGSIRFSLMPSLIIRIYAFPIFLIIAIIIFWFYFRISIFRNKKTSMHILYEFLDIVVLLLPPTILIVLFTLIISPRSFIIMLSMTNIHVATIMILSLIGRHLNKIDMNTKIALCAIIYAILAINLSPITKIIL
ncbi:MAG: hypothetical protein Q6363_001605, partial [Candidatus Njordarchaeota archaeon]